MAKDKVSFTDHPRRRHAILAMMLSEAEWTGNPEKLLWGGIAAIGVYGTSAKLKRQFDTVREVAFINRDLPMDEDERKKIAASLNGLGGYIKRLVVGAERIEKHVASLGCRVNAETGKVSTKQNSKGRDVVRERIWKIYSENYRKDYRFGDKKASRKQFAIRQEIGKLPALTSFIDESELRPDAKVECLIYDTIRRGEDRSKMK